jgi:hypothetical protein
MQIEISTYTRSDGTSTAVLHAITSVGRIGGHGWTPRGVVTAVSMKGTVQRMHHHALPKRCGARTGGWAEDVEPRLTPVPPPAEDTDAGRLAREYLRAAEGPLRRLERGDDPGVLRTVQRILRDVWSLARMADPAARAEAVATVADAAA